MSVPLNTLSQLNIRPLSAGEKIPYELLLIADPSKEQVDLYLHHSELYIAELAGEIVGVYVLLPLNEYAAEIKNIAVAEQYQGKGIGKLLLTHACQTSSGKGLKDLLIATGNSSIGPLALYQKSGFEIIELKKDFFTTNYHKPIYENGIQCKHLLVLRKQF